MAIFKGGTEISDLYVGPDEVQEVYRGSDLIWSNSVQRSDAFWSDTIGLWTHEPAGIGVLSWENQVTGNTDLTASDGDFDNTVFPAIEDGYWGTHLGKRTNQSSSANGAVLVANTKFPLGTGNFTIEFWTYQYTIITNPVNDVVSVLYDASNDGSQVSGSWAMTSLATNARAKVGNGAFASSANSSIQTNQWQHHAICRSGSTTTYYVDGVAGGSTSNYTGTMGGTYNPCLGALGKLGDREYSCNALFRQVRLTEAARYTGNFTPYQRFYYPGIV